MSRPSDFVPPSLLNGDSSRPTTTPEPLKVIVVGAGVAGLTATAALRKAGHLSQFKKEVGAAIQVSPNGARGLEYLGYDPARMRGVLCYGMTIHDGANGETLVHTVRGQPRAIYGAPWYFTYRVDLHNELRQLAFDPLGSGIMPVLHLSSRVASIDAEDGAITLENGDVHHADLIVAADGVHSHMRSRVFDGADAVPAGNTCYRFMLDAKEVFDNPEFFPVSPGDGIFHVTILGPRRVIMYPCRNNELFNFIFQVPNAPTASSEDWHAAATVDEVLAEFKDFCPQIQFCLRKAKDISKWTLLKRESIDSWVKGRVCLVGDAAHPMLPHITQGGSQAIEDGVALGPLFKLGTTGEQVPDLLKLYQQIRYTRASTIASLSREAMTGYESSSYTGTIQDYIFGHNVVEYARHTRSAVWLNQTTK